MVQIGRTHRGTSLAVVLTAMMWLPACGAGSTTTQTSPVLHLVAVGDSIPNNSPQDCPGCHGFVDRYAEDVKAATGRPVVVENLSQHNNLTLPGLLDELDQFRGQLAGADIVLVSIAHNTIELAADLPCGKPLKGDLPDWSAMDEQCAIRSTEASRPQYDRLYSHIAALRRGKLTILRTIDRYNDFIDPNLKLTPAQQRQTAMFLARWNTMICQSAATNGFGCADLSKAFNGPDGLKDPGNLLADDHTHPSDKGNETIARILADLGFAPLA
jgi:lysophospholipase L1-like esterase